MASSTGVRIVTVTEYLSDPAYEHQEYAQGHVVERNVGSKFRSRIQARCARKLAEYLDRRSDAYVATELHCRLQAGGDVRFRLPDVAVVLGDANPKENRYLEGAPALAIEIRSPEDSITQLVRKIDEYLANGSEMAWLLLPEEKGLMLFTPGAPVRTLLEHDTLEGGALLPGFQIRVSELFA